MARVYVSSTFSDLKGYRERVRHALRRRGHEDVAMELYGAEDKRPLDKCLADVAEADLYIGIFAWRYGYIPPDEHLSITELEYEAASQADKSCLLFLVAENAPWPVNLIETEKLEQQRRLRQRVSEDQVVAFFSNEDQLEVEVTNALVGWEKSTTSLRPHRSPTGRATRNGFGRDAVGYDSMSSRGPAPRRSRKSRSPRCSSRSSPRPSFPILISPRRFCASAGNGLLPR